MENVTPQQYLDRLGMNGLSDKPKRSEIIDLSSEMAETPSNKYRMTVIIQDMAGTSRPFLGWSAAECSREIKAWVASDKGKGKVATLLPLNLGMGSESIVVRESSLQAYLEKAAEESMCCKTQAKNVDVVMHHIWESRLIQIASTDFAFAALKNDGSVVTWGDPQRGGDSNIVKDQLSGDVKEGPTRAARPARLSLPRL